MSGENSLYSAGRVQIGRYFLTSSTFPFFVNHFFFRILLHVSGVQSSCFITSLNIGLVISFVISSHVLMSSARSPLLSLALPFFEAVDDSLHFILCELWYFIFHIIDMAFSFDVHSCFRVVRVLHFFSELIFSIEIAVEFTEGMAIPFLDVIVSPLSFFAFGMSVFFSSRLYA